MPTLMKIIAALAIFSLCRPVAAEEKMQHWLRANAALHDEGSPLFYVNQEDKGKILIILGEQVYLLETKYPSVVRVINTLPKENGEFEVVGITTEPLKDMTAIIQHIPGTPKFAGGMYWLGWLVCFQDNGKLDSDHQPRCYMFARYEEGSPSEAAPQEQNRPIVKREPIKVGGNVQESKLIRRVEPVYPELAKRARVEGRVLLVVTVDEEGNVSEIRVIAGHPLLVEAALGAVRQWKYSPTLLNGERVPVITTVTVRFSFAALGETAVPVGD
jgi:TonB family protein